MSKNILKVAGIGLFALGSAVIASPATAALADCGAEPTGGDLTWDSATNVCTLTFDTEGEYSWTPATVTGLQAIIAGAGGGANALNSTGYAGDGGRVLYVDLSEEVAGASLRISVGDGGISGETPTPGDNSIIQGVDLYPANGGDAGTGYPNFCALNGSNSTYVGLGDGAKNDTTTRSGEVCGTAGLGIKPSLGDRDFNNLPVPSLFRNYAIALGSGGVLRDNQTLPTQTPGQGASVNMNTTTTLLVSATNGSDGRVVFRWSLGAAAPALAATGSESARLAGLAGGIMSLGLGLVLAGSIRRRANR